MSRTSIRISALVLVGCLLAAALSYGQTAPATKGLSSAEVLELTTFSAQLSDAARQPKTRVEAAELLLSRSYPQAAEAIQASLADSTNVGGQIAVAEAILRRGEGRPEFIKPLLSMLTGEEATVRSPAARALAVYRTDGVTDRLIEIARDANRALPIRVEVIACLQRALDQKVVGALVGLLDDRSPSIVEAAGDSLGRLTNLRSIGSDPERWKEWWRKNESKPRSVWLAELAGSLLRSQADLEGENARLRDRLGKAMEDLYASALPAHRDGVLLGYLKDSVGDVRLSGAKLVERSIASAEPVSPEVRAQMKAMLIDPDPRVRQRSALVVASLGDANAGRALLERLDAEEAPEVRTAILTALGQVADPTTLPPILVEVSGRRTDVSAAAARTVARIASKQKLGPAAVSEIVRVLFQRYRQLARTEDGVELPEALLTAMGAVGSEEFLPVLIEATQDVAATVRLAAVGGLKQFARPEVAPVLEGMVSDSDRGVRQAALAALGAMGGQKNLQILLARTDPAVESDAAVRQQGWDSALGILSKADAATMKAVVAGLASRTDATDPRIKVRQMLAVSLRTAKDAELPDALRQLGQDLVKAGRPAEAVPATGEAYTALLAGKDPKAADAWQEWVDAMAAADDPAAVKALADQPDEKAFALGLQKTLSRLDALREKGKWQAIGLICAAGGTQLAPRLTAEQAKLLQARGEESKAKLAESDRQKVPALITQVVSGDEAIRKSAAGELQTMGDRAVAPLVEELKKAVSGEAENHAVEMAVLELLKQAAPKLTGYDPAAAKADRLKVIDVWLRR
jgi:HEAT repeat protein